MKRHNRKLDNLNRQGDLNEATYIISDKIKLSKCSYLIEMFYLRRPEIFSTGKFSCPKKDIIYIFLNCKNYIFLT